MMAPTMMSGKYEPMFAAMPGLPALDGGWCTGAAGPFCPCGPRNRPSRNDRSAWSPYNRLVREPERIPDRGWRAARPCARHRGGAHRRLLAGRRPVSN